MATKLSYEDYLKRINPSMLDTNGAFRGPNAGVNFMLEGQTPEQAYANAQYQQTRPFDDVSGGNTGNPMLLDPTWRDGPAATGVLNAGGHLLGEITKNPALMAGVLGGAASYFDVPGFTGESGAGSYGGGFGGEEFSGFGGGGTGEEVAGSLLGNESQAETARLLSMSGGGSGLGGISPGSTLSGGGGLLDSAAQWLKENPTLAKLGGAALGAIGGGKDATLSSSSSKDPWAPAQPYLLDNLKTNAASQEYYRQNPFSAEQKAQYQGLFDNLANNKANMAGLLGNANAFSQSKRGVMPAMTGLLSGTQAPAIDWNQYANIGRK